MTCINERVSIGLFMLLFSFHHAHTVSARRRRQEAADLSEVKHLKQHLKIPFISNGNVRVWVI
jgi:hypothetical protein